MHLAILTPNKISQCQCYAALGCVFQLTRNRLMTLSYMPSCYIASMKSNGREAHLIQGGLLINILPLGLKLAEDVPDQEPRQGAKQL